MNEVEGQSRSIEALQPSNNFQRFISENYEIFENLNSATLELKREDQARRSDPIIDELLGEALSVVEKSRFRFKKPGEIRAMINAVIFDNREYTEGQLHQGNAIYHRLSLGDIGELDELDKKFFEISDEYNEVITPLREARHNSRQVAQQSFSSYLLESTDNLGHFNRFMLDSNTKAQRENIRPFLLFLSEHTKKGKTETNFDQAVAIWKEKAVDEANDEILRQYIEEQLQGAQESISNGNAFFSGLIFGIDMGRAKYLGQEIDEGSLADMIIDYLKSNSWPEVIKSGYKKAFDTKYSPEINSVRVSLDQYRRVGEKFINGGEVFSHKDHKRRDRNRTKKNEAVEVKEEEVETKKEYSLGVLQRQESKGAGDSRFTVVNLSPEELELYLEKKANKIAPNDQRMLDDVKAIVENLRNNPYGFGTKKAHKIVSIGFKNMALRELVPAKRGSALPLSHDRSHDTRVTYIVDGETVIIEDIAMHTTFDRKLRKNL